MIEEEKQKNFNPKAHILTLLGNELIKSPVMAIYELVKNSYDADAKKVDVHFIDIEDTAKAVIVVEDDGIGMTSEIIEDVWLEPGTDFRKPIDKGTGLRQVIRSDLYKRVPMGEKGVGRFAVHKLSNQILLVTRPLLITKNKENGFIENSVLADYEIQLYIDWKDFSQSTHLSDVKIKWKVKRDKQEFRFQNKSGTYIRLSELKESWTKGMARDLKGQTLSMLSPKNKETDFKINLNFNNQWLVDFPSAERIIEDAPFKITALLESDYSIDFEYEFVLHNNKEIGQRVIKNDPNFNENIKGRVKAQFRKVLEKKEYGKDKIAEILSEFDLKPLPFGKVIIQLYTFDLDSASLKDYTENADFIKKVLKQHSGIKVFKNDLRIYDYGSPGNDWLGLDLERIQNKMWFSNNTIIGYVFLDAEASTCLIEKTNREGFVENDAYLTFYMVLKTVLGDFAATRFSDRARWLKYNQKSSNNFFDTRINDLRYLLENSDLSDEEKKEQLLSEVEKIEEKYEEDKNTLLIPAGVGMTASVALHEIEKLVPRMEETIKSDPFNKQLIADQVDELKEYTEGIISVLRKGGDKPIDVKDAITRAFSNYKLKLTNRGIEYEALIDKEVDTLKCDKRFLITMLMNIIDNSIYWLDTIYKKEKGIFLSCVKKDKSTIITVADNGPGFKDPISDIIRPFFSRKSDGIGIGMYLIDTIMMKYGKLEIVSELSEKEGLKIPQKFDGAIVKLVFNKNQ